MADRAQDRRRGGALGFQQSAGALARIVGPVLGGVLFQHVGVAAPYAVGAAMVVVALLLVAGIQSPVPAVARAASEVREPIDPSRLKPPRPSTAG